MQDLLVEALNIDLHVIIIRQWHVVENLSKWQPLHVHYLASLLMLLKLLAWLHLYAQQVTRV